MKQKYIEMDKKQKLLMKELIETRMECESLKLSGLGNNSDTCESVSHNLSVSFILWIKNVNENIFYFCGLKFLTRFTFTIDKL